MLIYLFDGTHTGQIVASNVMPLAIGMIGATILRDIPGARVELFKMPNDLNEATSNELPDVLGLSVYSWNTNLGMEYARRMKLLKPDMIVIAGGPNWEDNYWQLFPWVDFYVEKEGELATVELLRTLQMVDMQPDVAKMTFEMPSTHFMFEGQLIKTPLMPRVKSLDDLPSPYTTGLMSSFPPLTGPIVPLTGIAGSPPDLAQPPPGCRFNPRCPQCTGVDPHLFALQTGERPVLREVEPGHRVACHWVDAR